MKVELLVASAADIPALVADARQQDIDEMHAMGDTFEGALRKGVEISTWAVTGCVDGVPVCMFGVAPGSVLGGLGIPWMLGTNALMRHEKAFLRRCKGAVAAMLRTYPRLLNIVDERNDTAKRWLVWLGFRLDPHSFALGSHRFRVFRAGETPHV